ncbi:hypothetical protein EI981_03625 [Paenibacillus lutimineralis]|uniref:Uncharacterized protein n=2 Tax=Paenibacillus lutimineralis TaxID=2707005 RepID=A0A3Q9IA27_9BACL|nr:hypothetical protein EI981_03625 [Paenibacillus lutimineralis]
MGTMNKISSSTRAGSLFRRRWLDYIRHQTGVLRTAFDGVVLLYIGIPGLLLLGRVYYGLWQDVLPSWLTGLPFQAVPVALILLTLLLGGLVLYIEAADVLFLKQHPKWVREIMLRATSLALVQRLVVILLEAVLLLPLLWRVYGMGSKEIIILFVLTYTMNAVYLLLSNLLAVVFTGLRRTLLGVGGTGSLLASYIIGVLCIELRPEISVIILLCYILVSVWLIGRRVSLQGRFERAIREEERQRTKLTGMILQPSVERPVKTRPRPWLFRRSGHLIRQRQVHDRVTEAAVKSFFRGREVLLYVQFTIYGFTAVFLPPYPVNLLVYIGLILLLFQWMNSQRRAFYQVKLLAILPKDENLEFICAPKTMRLLLFPAILVITAGLCMNLFTPGWGLLAAIPLGPAVSLLAVPVLWRFFSMSSRRRKV